MPKPQPLYRQIARTLSARDNCERSGNSEWLSKHCERLESISRDLLPSGSGFDQGTTIDFERSGSDRIVLRTSFHHTDESGGYDGWTDHTVTVRPSLAFGFVLRVSGRDRNGIKSYIADEFHEVLSRPFDY